MTDILSQVPSTASLPTRAKVVVIGAGIMGLSIAYNMALRGEHDIVVLDRTYLCGGASGRNGGGVRAQWSSELNIRLMREAISLCEDFATKMRINVWFRQGGYLFVAHTDARAKELAQSVELQRSCGLSTRLIDRKDAKRIVPELDDSRIVAASYNPDDGVVFPWPFVWGYANACQKLGVGVFPFTEVTQLTEHNQRVTGVVTSRGTIAAETVIVACGAYSPEVTRLVGLDLPSKPHRHEICSTEPLKPFLKPLVADLASGLYFSQSMRGEIVGGISNHRVPEGANQDSSLRFLGLYARELQRAAPILGELRVLRQWAGCYDITPDSAPLIGHVDERPGLVLASGFMGHGFMMAPVMGRLFAEHLLEGRDHEVFPRWNLRRFKEGRLEKETMILG